MSVGGEFKMAIYTQVFEWEFAGCFSHASQSSVTFHDSHGNDADGHGVGATHAECT